MSHMGCKCGANMWDGDGHIVYDIFSFKDLKDYIENNIFKEYSKNEEAHGLNHIKFVIKRSLDLSKDKDLDINMIYTIAAYHDIGHHIDAKNHEAVSAKILLEDENYY